MATSVLEQILLNVKGGALLPLETEPTVDPSPEIEEVVQSLASQAEDSIRQLARTILRSPDRGGAEAPARFRDALRALDLRDQDAAPKPDEPEQLNEIQNLLEELDPTPTAPTAARVPLEDIQSMIELLK